jgi:hypothetical protein
MPIGIQRTRLWIDQSDDDNLTQDYAAIDGLLVVGIEMPAAWTAANITFEGSNGTDLTEQGGTGPFGVGAEATKTFGVLADQNGTTITVTAPAALEFIQLDPSKFLGVRYLKLGTSAGQAADRIFWLVTRHGA